MGYLVTGHVFREKPDLSRLGELPQSIGFRVYLHRAANLYLLDTFRASKVPPYPFQTLLPSVDIPLELPSSLEVLERLYSRLSKAKLANSFKKSYLNAALILSRLVQVPVFSFVSDDDELDFTCSAANGDLTRLKCRCGDLLVFYDSRNLQIVPLVPEAEEDEDMLTDTGSLKSAIPEAEVLPREMPWNSQLHWIAMEELQEFTDLKEMILGLGSFDPPDDEPEWQLVTSR